ncbi:MAG: hypothetical protein JWO89_2993, partial [Verrucomicrobiaceae bacterium]|nr:hypothetical protein [Verrucomicrobiaceae bacterium]
MHTFARLALMSVFAMGSLAWAQQKPKANETNSDDMWVAK